jgi:hypothetical protein
MKPKPTISLDHLYGGDGDDESPVDKVFEAMKASPVGSMEMSVVCNPRDGYKVRIDIWENDHGDINKPRGNKQNPAHATVLAPGTKKPTPNDVKAKLNITDLKPPKTIAELDGRLFSVKSGKLSRKERDSILEWANDTETIGDAKVSNWASTRKEWTRLHPDQKLPEEEV